MKHNTKGDKVLSESYHSANKRAHEILGKKYKFGSAMSLDQALEQIASVVKQQRKGLKKLQKKVQKK